MFFSYLGFSAKCALFGVDTETIATQVTVVKGVIIPASMDSDLEAFSHNPTDGSFAALAVQPTALPNI